MLTNHRHIDIAAETLRAAEIDYHPRTRDDIAAAVSGYRLHTPGLNAPLRWLPEATGTGGYTADTEPLHPAAWDLAAYAAIGQRHQ
ncbi:SAM-dependent methyltransferase [Nocardia mangyaensis]|uniref:SAM-dependent methyltransferase n=1 Tax=Nocardia mangyaensis TaxID=2213200 RepID=UPI00267570AE|nr:SAM-dependent methyltransferase [Nocardia mangyaensis]MDO3651206.1 SAM-dependent methyltransferase [Nocardia mangyaensis]